METNEIKRVFDMVFNNMPNPIFSRPIQYFCRGNFLFEIAITPSFYEIYNPIVRRNKVTWLSIFAGLFVDADGCWVTVLEKTQDGSYRHRTDLSRHIENKHDWEKIIEDLDI